MLKPCTESSDKRIKQEEMMRINEVLINEELKGIWVNCQKYKTDYIHKVTEKDVFKIKVLVKHQGVNMWLGGNVLFFKNNKLM